MILDTLQNAARYQPLHPLFAHAFDFLANTDLAALATGRHDIIGDELYVMVNSGEGQGHGASPLEAHRLYIDIHLTLEGTEEIGWRPIEKCQTVTMPYDAEGDAILFSDAAESYTTIPPGAFAIYFPEDAHVPGAGNGAVKKVVVKIAVK